MEMIDDCHEVQIGFRNSIISFLECATKQFGGSFCFLIVCMKKEEFSMNWSKKETPFVKMKRIELSTMSLLSSFLLLLELPRFSDKMNLNTEYEMNLLLR